MMLLEIEIVKRPVMDEFLDWLAHETWTKSIPVGFLVAQLILPEQNSSGEQIDWHSINWQQWPTNRNYEAVARGKLALSIREGMDSLAVVTDLPWLLRSGDCRWGGAILITPPECNTKIWVAFSGLTVEEDIRVARKYGEILLRRLNELARARLEALDASDGPNGNSFLQ